MKVSKLTTFLLLLCVLLAARTSVAQQRQSASPSELKSQIAKLEEIDRDPGTPADVKNINHTFLESRRAELRDLLVHRRDALRAYLSSSGAILRAEEVERVKESIRGLGAEFQKLSAQAELEGPSTLPVSSTPREAPAEPIRPSTVSVAGARLLPAAGAAAQTPCPTDLNDLITGVVLSTGGVTSAGTLQNTLEVSLSVPLSLTNQPSDVTVIGSNLRIPTAHFKITTQGGSTFTILTPSSPITTLSGTGRDTLLINLAGSIPASATRVTVTLGDLAFECPSAANPTLIGATSNSGNITPNAALLASDIEALNKANKAAAAKRSDDKDFRMGFTMAKGGGKDAQGAADLSFNRKFFGGGQNAGNLFDFFDQADVSFQLKKSSAENADPRHLNLSLNLRKSFLVDSRLRVPDAGVMTRSEAERRVKSKGFFRVLSIKQGLNLEGEAFDFKTTNFVSDTHFELASIAKKLGAGFYNVNIFTGPEIGRNLAKPDAATVVGATAEQLASVDWITRLKAGGEFTLRLLPSASSDNWGVELNLGYVNRYLFSSEIFTQKTTKDGETTTKVVTVGKGNKAWRQADLKVFLFGNQRARYGVKLSYSNGQLPPAFIPTRGFQFGLVVESTDDTKGDESANKQ